MLVFFYSKDITHFQEKIFQLIQVLIKVLKFQVFMIVKEKKLMKDHV